MALVCFVVPIVGFVVRLAAGRARSARFPLAQIVSRLMLQRSPFAREFAAPLLAAAWGSPGRYDGVAASQACHRIFNSCAGFAVDSQYIERRGKPNRNHKARTPRPRPRRRLPQPAGSGHQVSAVALRPTPPYFSITPKSRSRQGQAGAHPASRPGRSRRWPSAGEAAACGRATGGCAGRAPARRRFVGGRRVAALGRRTSRIIPGSALSMGIEIPGSADREMRSTV
jgi:hypothetical protein